MCVYVCLGGIDGVGARESNMTETMKTNSFRKVIYS